MCPAINCEGWTEERGAVCAVCWDYRPVIHGSLIHLWHLAHEFLPAPVSHVERVSGGMGPTSKAPLNSRALDAIESTLAVVVGWASIVRTQAGLDELPGLGTARPDWLFDQAVPTLMYHDGVLGNGQAVTYYNDLFRCKQILVRVTHMEQQETERIEIACPDCGRMSVVARGFGEYVACLTCCATWGQSAWHAKLTRSNAFT